MTPTPRTRIVKARRMQGLSRADIASRLRVSERTVMRWELGQTGIPDDHKLALSELFGVSVPYLMHWANGDSSDKEAA